MHDPFAAASRKPATAPLRRRQAPTKLSYKDQRELDALPDEIEAIETQVIRLQETVSGPDFYTRKAEEVRQTLAALSAAEALLAAKNERWEALEARQAQLKAAD